MAQRLPFCVVLALFACCASRTAKAPADPPSASASAAAPNPTRSEIETLLDQDAPEARWKQLGPTAEPLLEAIFNDATQSSERRTRAVASLGRIDNPAATGELKALLKDGKLGVEYRSAAALALGHAVGPTAVGDLKPLLAEANSNMREAGARALGSAGGADARASLEDQLEKEDDPSVREAIQQSLTKLQQ